MDNIGLAEVFPIYVGGKDKWLGRSKMNAVLQFVIYFEFYELVAMLASCLDLNRKFLFSQLPLHEGCRNRVYRSSSVETLS